MWSVVGPYDSESPSPSARSKHTATLVGDNVYLLGGRNGNIPLKDLWKYNLGKWKDYLLGLCFMFKWTFAVCGKWEELKPSGDRLPALQEHTAVVYKGGIYIFGGEVGFSAATETPLWLYNIEQKQWRKIRPRKGKALLHSSDRYTLVGIYKNYV